MVWYGVAIHNGEQISKIC